MNAATKRAADQERLSSGREREREGGRVGNGGEERETEAESVGSGEGSKE